MALKNDIQNAIIDPKKRLSDVLRKATILAHRLKSEEFKHWIDQESNGYGGNIEDLPTYRVLSTQTFGHFSGPFHSGLRNAPIPSAHFPEEIHKYATTQPFPQSVRELESIIENSKGNTVQIHWPADLVVPIADKVYENMVCMQAWKDISINQIEGIIDTVRNRLLRFILEIEEMDPEAGESSYEEGRLTPDKVAQTFNNYILGNHNIIGSGSNFTLSVYQNITQGDFKSLESALKHIGVKEADIKELSEALAIDGVRKQTEGIGHNVIVWIGNMVQKVVSGVWDVALETAPLLLSKMISSYYGWI